MMRYIVKYLIIAFTILAGITWFNGRADAAEVDISWEAPTTRTNGAPLDQRELREYEVQWTCLAKIDSVLIPAELTRTTQTIDLSGPCGFQVKAIDVHGLMSEWSDPAIVILPAEVPPNAPASITIEIKFN